MFGGLDNLRLEFLWIDGKKHLVQIKENGELIDLRQLSETYHKMAENKEDQCKAIAYLGLGLTGDPDAAKGFLYGWLVKSIKDTVEAKNNTKWKIDHDVSDVTEGEARSHLAKELRELADKIENDTDYKVKKAPILRGDITDGTQLF